MDGWADLIIFCGWTESRFLSMGWIASDELKGGDNKKGATAKGLRV